LPISPCIFCDFFTFGLVPKLAIELLTDNFKRLRNSADVDEINRFENYGTPAER
jgi:hypothetical protein